MLMHPCPLGKQASVSLGSQREEADLGQEIFALVAEIYPICRSITGNGVRQTLSFLGRHIDLSIHEVPSGTQVFDWTIPPEWNIRDAYIKNVQGERIVDFRKSNLHVLNYSIPVHTRMPLSELRKHIFTLPEQPDLIPYRTSFYAERWGFCMAHNQLSELPEDIYEVYIDASLEDGHLTYGEYLHRGELEDEVLLSAHICHPSLANDNCSGLATLTYLARNLAQHRTRYSYRFLFAPGTIGAITWLARNEARAAHIKHGLVVSCIGDGGGTTYKRSRRGDAVIDRAMAHVLRHMTQTARILDFIPYGYDERQYCSPGFNLPVGLFQRSQFGCFPEYHTSADDLTFVKPEHLAESYNLISAALDIVENDRRLTGTMQKCEPQLGRRGLYESVGGDKEAPEKNMARLWVLNLADGTKSLLDMAERAGMPFRLIAEAAKCLEENGLLTASGVSAMKHDAVTQNGPSTRSGHVRSLSEMAETGKGQVIAKAGSS
jgi:aminopeptidase-like protein